MPSNSALAGPMELFVNVKTTTTGRVSAWAAASDGTSSAPLSHRAARETTVGPACDMILDMEVSSDSIGIL